MSTSGKKIGFAFFVAVLIVLSSVSVLAQETEQPQPSSTPPADNAAATATASATPTTSRIPNCVGWDTEKLFAYKQGYQKCLRFKDLFQKYAQQEGLSALGMDDLLIYTTVLLESTCMTREEMKAANKKTANGGIMQVDWPCLHEPEKCPTLDDEIREGMKETSEKLKAVLDKGMSGKEGLWMSWFSYNRGGPCAKFAMNRMAEGKTIQEATDEACARSYGHPDGTCGITCKPSGRTANGCTEYYCDYEFYCRVKYTDVGVHYSDKRWHEYVDACENAGGKVVDQGAPITLGAAVTSEEGAAPEAAEAAGFKPTHPYFTVPYSINPSFSVTVPYDLAIYDEMPGYINKLVSCRDDVDCITGNVSLIEEEKKDLNWVVSYGGNIVSRDKAGILEYPHWQAYCEDPEQHAINSIAEAIDACARSKSKDCVCPYTLPIVRVEEISSWFFESLMAGEMESFTSSILGIGLLSVRELSGQEWDYRILGFKKAGSGLKVSLFSTVDVLGVALPISREAQVVDNADFKSVAPDWRYEDNSKTLKYYVSSAGAVLDLYKDNNNNISIGSQGSATSQKQCELHNKVLKFCIIQNKTFMAYNQRDNKMGMQQLVLKFSYLFKSEVTDVKGFEVKDARMATNTSLVMWEPVLGADVEQYNLFHTDNLSMAANLKGVSPADISLELRTDLEHLGPGPLPVAEQTYADVAIADLLSPICIVEGTTCQMKYKVTTKTGPAEPMPLDLGVLYYSRVDERFFYFMPDVNNDPRYVFAITATESDGTESPSYTQPGEGKQEDSVHDLPPALATIGYPVIEGGNLILPVAPVNSNIDGSYLDPVSVTGFMLYCFESAKLATFTDTVPLSSGRSLSVSGESLVDGGTRLVIPLSDLEPYCSFQSSPKVANIVVAATKGPTQFYQGEVSSGSFLQVTLP
jgi:hypothetical protein